MHALITRSPHKKWKGQGAKVLDSKRCIRGQSLGKYWQPKQLAHWKQKEYI